MTVDELIQFMRQTIDEVFAKVLNARENVFLDNAALDLDRGSPRCAELRSAREELQHQGVRLDSDLEAGLEFILGRIADNSDVVSRHHYEQSLALWQQIGDRERCGLLLFYIGLWWRNYAARNRVEYQQAADRAREYFQQSIEAFERADRPDLVAKFINNAFHIKQDRQAIESQFGFRAFIGAGRLQPKQQIANPALPSAASPDEVAQEIASSGRLHSVERLLERIDRDDCKLTIIHGESGVGKSSIEQAGLIPALKQNPINARSVMTVLQQVYANWADELANCLTKELVNIQKRFPLTLLSVEEREDDGSDFGLDSPTISLTDSILAQLRKNADYNLLTILIFDQFEEFFFICKDSGQRKKFYDFLHACLDIPYVKVILSLREDYLHYLLECTRFTNFDVIHDNILDKNILFYLGNFKPDEAKLVIQSLTEKTQFELEPALIDELVKDLAGEVNEVRPVELQIVGAQSLMIMSNFITEKVG